MWGDSAWGDSAWGQSADTVSPIAVDLVVEWQREKLRADLVVEWKRAARIAVDMTVNIPRTKAVFADMIVHWERENPTAIHADLVVRWQRDQTYESLVIDVHNPEIPVYGNY